MALKQLILGRGISELEKKLTDIAAEREGLESRRAAHAEREQRAVEAFGELTEETDDETRAAFDAEAAEIESEAAEIEAAAADIESRENAAKTELETKRGELAAIEAKNDEAERAAAEKAKKKEPETPAVIIDRTEKKEIENMTPERKLRRERIEALAVRDDIKAFCKEVRDSRAITGKTLLIPDVMLPMVTADIAAASKLMPYLRTEYVKGDGKVTLSPTIPEGKWTDAFGALYNLGVKYNRIDIQGGKVSAYVPVANAILEDNDVNLISDISYKLGAANGRALDRAFLYGTGTNMPVGIVTRLAATLDTDNKPPAWWGADAPDFVALGTTNIKKASSNTLTGLALFKEIAGALGVVEHFYTGNYNLFWAMNPKTKIAIKTAAAEFNAAAAVVSELDDTMPIIGGRIVEVDSGIIPDNAIIGGYGDNYIHADRAGYQLRVSDQVNFLADETVYACTSRHDGKPLEGKAFAAFSITTTAIATTSSFVS